MGPCMARAFPPSHITSDSAGTKREAVSPSPANKAAGACLPPLVCNRLSQARTGDLLKQCCINH